MATPQGGRTRPEHDAMLALESFEKAILNPNDEEVNQTLPVKLEFLFSAKHDTKKSYIRDKIQAWAIGFAAQQPGSMEVYGVEQTPSNILKYSKYGSGNGLDICFLQKTENGYKLTFVEVEDKQGMSIPGSNVDSDSTDRYVRCIARVTRHRYSDWDTMYKTFFEKLAPLGPVVNARFTMCRACGRKIMH